MLESLRTFMYLFDLIGKNPQLLIFSRYCNKSILSALVSLIIILISINFSILAILEYLKFRIRRIIMEKPLEIFIKKIFYCFNYLTQLH